MKWLIGAVLGLLIGNAIGPAWGLAGMIIGGIVGYMADRRGKGGLAGGQTGGAAAGHGTSLDERVARLEAQVMALEAELSVLRAHGQLPGVAAATEQAETPPSPVPALAAEAGMAPTALAIPVPAPDRPDAAPAAMTAATAPAAVAATAATAATPTSAPEAPSSAGADAPPPGALPPPTPIEVPAWVRRLWEGNPLAKIGIVLLCFGIASGLKLAVDYGLVPVRLRLALAAALGLAMIGFGLNRVRNPERTEHRTFGLALQGGGFAVLYLTGYFALARYALIGNEAAFVLFAAVGVVCVLLAARQDDAALAVFGLSGAFLAPVLAGSRADSPLGLFLYFTLLNALIVAVDWFKAWRVLNLAGFIFTLAVGMAWATQGYEPRHHAVTQAFLILFLALYSAMPVVTALLRARGAPGWIGGMLLFGTPLAGAFLQTRLMRGIEYGLAWSALIAALWYFALWSMLLRRPGRRSANAPAAGAARDEDDADAQATARIEAGNLLLERSLFGIAIALITVAVPLAFGAQVTSAFWAAEGTAVLWYGVRMRRRLAQASGLAMQVLAGLALADGWDRLHHGAAVFNNAMLGAFILTVAGLLAARLLRTGAAQAQEPGAQTGMIPASSLLAALTRLARLPVLPIPALLPFLWASAWWLGAGIAEIDRCLTVGEHAAVELLFIAASMIVLEALARLWRWPQLRGGSLLLLLAMLGAAVLTVAIDDRPFAGWMVLALPLSFAIHYGLLALHERSGAVPLAATRHLGAWWLGLLVVPTEISWHVERASHGVALWPFVAWALTLACGTALPVLAGARRWRWWPWSSPVGSYLPAGAALPAVTLAVLLAAANFTLSGDMGRPALPWVPVLNVFDLTMLAGMGALLLLIGTLGKETRPASRTALVALAFLWISAMAARATHFWGGVPFEFDAMFGSTLFQSLLTVIWTIAAIGTMIYASRHAYRAIWFGGFTLLAVVGAKLLLIDASDRGTLAWTGTLLGVALLVLAASYFAPVPPRRQSQVPNDMDNAPRTRSRISDGSKY